MPHWASTLLLFQSDSGKLLFRALFLDSCFQNNPDSVMLQKYQTLLNQSFKHNSMHMRPLNLTPKFSFEARLCIFIINFYYTKTKYL